MSVKIQQYKNILKPGFTYLFRLLLLGVYSTSHIIMEYIPYYGLYAAGKVSQSVWVKTKFY